MMLKVPFQHEVMLESPLAPKIGNMHEFSMLVIGTSRLGAYWTSHPEAKAPLEALNALLSAAQWRNVSEMLRHWPAIARMADDRLITTSAAYLAAGEPMAVEN